VRQLSGAADTSRLWLGIAAAVALAVPVRLLAAAVAYSRVHTGVHYPGDVVIGSVTGAGTAAMVAAVADRLGRARAASGRAR
jgi:membrane-associated phospholipid phosphatase